MRTYHIAVIPGDGIGVEVMTEGRKVLERVSSLYGFRLCCDEYPWGSEYYLCHGSMMPENALEQLTKMDAIYLGAVGDSRLQDNITLGGMLLPIRQTFQQFANVRPTYLFEGVNSPLAGRNAGSIDCVVVRENTEGEYCHVGGRVHKGSDREVAIQTAVFSYQSTERIIRYAFELALTRGNQRKVTSITKSNAQGFSMVLWDEVFQKVAQDYPLVQNESRLIDAACMDLIREPDTFDVLVGSNLFGDILSEVTASITGGLGLAPSANIDPTRTYPSMFEPVHGSAPDIAGKGLANPVATILAAQMMLEFLGEKEGGQAINRAVKKHLREGKRRTRDLGGDGTCREAADEIAGFLDG